MKKSLPSILVSSFLLTLLFSVSIASMSHTGNKESDEKIYFQVPYPSDLVSDPLNGRLMVMLSSNSEAEPRFQISDGPETQLVFGIDIEDWELGDQIEVSNEAYGYPIVQLSDVPPGPYFVQILLNRYEAFHRKDGHTVLLPPDRGEGQQWNRKPGNLLSPPIQIEFDPDQTQPQSLSFTKKIPAIDSPADTEYVKHIKIRSELLSDFWGRDMFLGAHVLLPYGWADHAEVRYPLAIMHGHFPADFGGWRTEIPDPDLEADFSDRFQVSGYNSIVQQEAYDFYQQWIGPDFPRVIAITIQHANPFYDDSYAVNSANVGPYGDAITYELIPYIEDKFRGIGKGWARFVYGGSTGGWEALAVQVMYPTEYGGCFAACPDPIDFRAYCLVNLYEDKNAYYLDSKFKKALRPGHRDNLGHVSSSLRDMNLRELALGTKSRSGQQWDIWEAVYSPVGHDGYPMRIWDKQSGAIDPIVARHWRDNYDLAYILKRDWPKHGKDWQGKIRIYCGDMDNYYLNNAVYLAEEILKNTSDPYYDGEVDYGDRAEHCWNGDHTQPNHISRLRYHQMFITKWVTDLSKTAPVGADLTSWRY
ncbi:MAG: alpha/beta hydrolase-fold protein [Saprospiraceae bacterium]|nr:alpha/beta hydrolase-fold protein [Saprospiraceae bacterium]